MIRKILATIIALTLLVPTGRAGTQDARAPRRPPITGLASIAVRVKDVNRSREFYKNYLGFAEPYSLATTDGDLRMTWIKINDNQTIKLLPITDREPPSGDRRSIAYFSLATDDAAAMRDYLAAQGVKAPGGKELPEKVSIGQTGDLSFFIADPDGHVVEFVQYLPDGWNRRHQGQSLPATRVSVRMTHTCMAIGPGDPLIDFYRDVLGFKVLYRNPTAGAVQVPEGDSYIEFMPPGPHGYHFCLEVPDLAMTVATLKSRTCPAGAKEPGPIRLGANRKLKSVSNDPDGTVIEWMEPHVKGW